MSLTLSTLITDAGRDAAIAAASNGLSLSLTQMAFGTGTATPAVTWTALQNEQERIPILGGAKVAPAQLQVNALLQSSQTYLMSQIGIFASDGTLFAIAWRETGILEKADGIPYPVAFDLPLIGIPANNVTINVAMNFDLLFLGPVAALVMAVAGLTRRQVDQELRIRALEGRWTGGMKGTPSS